eukprot:5735565-Lingulodinium_polyedra.AAC.1
MHPPPRGGRRMECVEREMRRAAAMECSCDRMSEQFSRESCSEIRQKRIPWSQRRAFRDVSTSCADHHM